MGKPNWYTFAELSALPVSPDGFYKPGGTMGSHHMFISAHDDRIVVRGSNSGDEIVAPGDVLGYQHGDVWVVKPTHDPVKQLLRDKRISTRVLRDSDDAIRVERGSRQLGASYHSFDVGSRAEVLGTGGGRRVLPEFDRPAEPFNGGTPVTDRWVEEVSGGEVIVVTSSRMTGPIDTSTTICEIAVRTNVSRARAAALLRGYFGGA